jgi:signal transduction histidine kinase
VGIEEEERGRIFDRFYRGSTARGGEYAGSGLGLAICAQIVKEIGGRIEVESRVEPPAGTRMRVYLPRAREGTEGQDAPGGRSRPEGGAP